MFDRGATGNVMEIVLAWLDLASHFRLRESSVFYRDEVPRQSKALVVRGIESARRCHEKIFAAYKTRLHSISLDLSRSAPGSLSSPPSSSCSPSSPVGAGDCSSGSSGSSGRSRGAVDAGLPVAETLPRLVREHHPMELIVRNMVRGSEFSAALLALEESLEAVRLGLRVLQLGFATAGPRPYQDPRFHHWCILRLVLVLGGAKAAAAVGGGAGVGGGKLAKELADLSREFTATTDYLVGPKFVEEARGGVLSALCPGGTRLGAFAGKAHWPRLRELRLSCGIMGGDLEGLAECLGSNMPALEVLEIEGHSFRAPPTDLVAFADALGSTSKGRSCRTQLTTLHLKNFKIEGVDGLAALGRALSADRFPRLSALSFGSCRLGDNQLRVLSAALLGMSRSLKSLDLRSNYALSVGGITALAEALEVGCASKARAPCPHTSGCSSGSGGNGGNGGSGSCNINSSNSRGISNRSNSDSSSISDSHDGIINTSSGSNSNNSNNSSISNNISGRGQGARNNNPYVVDQRGDGGGRVSPPNVSFSATTSTTGDSMTSTSTHERAPAWGISAAHERASTRERAPAWSVAATHERAPAWSAAADHERAPAWSAAATHERAPTWSAAATHERAPAWSVTATHERALDSSIYAIHERAPAWSIPTPTPCPPSSLSGDWQRTPTPALPPLLIESLDLSYSCLWRRSRRTPQSLKPIPPFPRLLRALGNGACPRLKRFSLAGCYLRDDEVAKLVAALESGCRALQVLDITENLFGEVGIRLLLGSLLGGRMPRRLRVKVSANHEHPLAELYVGMPLEDVDTSVDAWLLSV